MKRIGIVTFLAVQLVAQNSVMRQGTSPSGDVDFSSARTTKPVRTGGTLPGACVANELFFLTNVGLQQCVKGKFSALGNGGTWGTVGGAIAAQTDLWNTLQNKQAALKGTPSQYVRGDGSLGSLAGVYEPVDSGILRSGSSYVNPPWSKFSSAGIGAVARTTDSKLSETTSVKDFGAVGDGTADDTAAIQAALNTCNATTWRTIYFPQGTYKTTSTLLVNWGRCNVRGAAILVSQINYQPTAPGSAFIFSQGSSVLFQGLMADIKIVTSDTANVKTAIKLMDVSRFVLERVTISGFHDVTNSSVGLNVMGRELSSIGPVDISADIPERFSKNPNIHDQSLEDLDHFRFFDQNLGAHLNPVILVDDGVYFSNTTFDGYQSWNLGTYGLYRNNTLGPSANFNLKISNVRWEQTESDVGYMIYLGGTAGSIQNLTVSNIGGATTGVTAPMGSGKGTNGIYLRNISGGLLENYRFTGDKFILSANGTVSNFRIASVYHPNLSATWDTAGFISFTKTENGTIGIGGVVDQPNAAPFAFKENTVPATPSGACVYPKTWYGPYADTTTSAPHFMDCAGVPWFIARFQTKGIPGNFVKWNADGTLGDLGYVPIPPGDVTSAGVVTKINGGTVPISTAMLATNSTGQAVASTILSDNGTAVVVTGRSLTIGSTALAATGVTAPSATLTTPLSPASGGAGGMTNVPPALRFLGDGSDGAINCNGPLSGTKYASTFTVTAGNTCTSSAVNSALVVYATGSCTVAGTINARGSDAGFNTIGDGGGPGGGGGGGAAAGVAGSGVSLIGSTLANGGTAGALSGGLGGTSSSMSVLLQRVPWTTLVGIFKGGSKGGAGGSSGPVGGNGGQAVILTCASINFTGSIDVSGAPGGTSTGNSIGASGGGGAGYVWLIGRDSVVNAGTISASGGSGGSCGSYTTCGAGGTGGMGWSKAAVMQ